MTLTEARIAHSAAHERYVKALIAANVIYTFAASIVDGGPAADAAKAASIAADKARDVAALAYSNANDAYIIAADKEYAA